MADGPCLLAKAARTLRRFAAPDDAGRGLATSTLGRPPCGSGGASGAAGQPSRAGEPGVLSRTLSARNLRGARRVGGRGYCVAPPRSAAPAPIGSSSGSSPTTDRCGMGPSHCRCRCSVWTYLGFRISYDAASATCRTACIGSRAARTAEREIERIESGARS